MPPLQRQLVSFPFRSGLDLKTSDKQVEPNKLLQIINGRFLNTGRIDKRFGSAALDADVQPPSGNSNWLAVLNDEILTSQEVQGVYSQLSYSIAQKSFRVVGNRIPIEPTWSVADASQLDHSQVETCYSPGQPSGPGYVYTAFITSAGLSVVCRDVETGVVVMAPTLIDASGDDPRFTVANNYVTLFYRHGTTLYYAQFQGGALTTTARTVGLASSIPSDLQAAGSQGFECRVISDPSLISGAPYVAIAWLGNVSDAFGLQLAAWNPSTRALGNGSNGLPAPQTISLTDNTHLGAVGMWVCTSAAAQVSLLIAVSQYANVAAYPTHQTIQFVWTDTQENVISGGPYVADSTTVGWGRMTCSGAPTDGGAYVQLLYEEGNGAINAWVAVGSVPSVKCVEIQFRGTYRKNSGLQATPQRVAAQVVLAADAWSGPGSPTQVAVTNVLGFAHNQIVGNQQAPPSTQQTCFVASLGALYGSVGTWLVQSKLLCAQFGGQPDSFRLTQSTALSATEEIFGVTQQTGLSGEFENAPQFVRAALVVSLEYGVQPVRAAGGGNLHFEAGVVSVYDSSALAEHNFHLYPEAPIAIGSPVAVIRQQAGVGDQANYTNAKPEQTLITIPPPLFSPDQTLFGSGWQIQPGSYFTLFTQVDSRIAEETPLGASLGYAFFFVVDGIGAGGVPIANVQYAPAYFNGYGGQTDAPTGQSAPLPSLTGGTYTTGDGYTSPGWLGILPVYINSTDSDIEICNNIATAINKAQSPSGAASGAAFAAWVVGQSGSTPQSGACAVEISNFTASSGKGWAGTGSGSAGQGYQVNPGLPSSWSDTMGCMPVSQLTADAASVSFLTVPQANRIAPGGYMGVPISSSSLYSLSGIWFQVDGVGAAPSSPVAPTGGASGGAPSATLDFEEVNVASTVPALVVSGGIGNSASALATLYSGSIGWYGFGGAYSLTNGWLTPAWLPQALSLPYECGLLGGNNGAYPDAAGYFPYDVSSAGWAIEANQGGAGPADDPSSTTLTPPGNSTLSVWQYVNVYEFVDGQGQIHRSAPSIPAYCIVNGTFKGLIGGTPTGGCMPRLIIPPGILSLSAKGLVSITTYRTLINGSVFYRCSNDAAPFQLPVASVPGAYSQSIAIAPPSLAVDGGTLANWEALVDPVQFADTTGASGSIANSQTGQQQSLDPVEANPVGYWQVGVPLQSAPAANCAIWHLGRLWVISSENPLLLYYSQLYVPGTQVAVGFNLIQPFSITLPEAGAALGSMDDSLVVFTSTGRIYRITGSGPGLNGQSVGNDFSAPQLVTSDVGCEIPNSVVLGPMGLAFQSAKGLSMLLRNWMVDSGPYGFGRVVDGLVLGNTVLGAEILPDRQEMRFAMSSGDVLLYQYDFQNWSRTVGWTSGATCIYDGLFTFINPTTSAMWQETPNLYLDNGSPYSMTIQTPWYKVNQLQGAARIWKMFFLGTFQSDHILQLQIAKDYNPTPQAVCFFNAIEALGSQAPGIYGGVPYGGVNAQQQSDGMTYEFQLWVPPPLNRAEAIQFTISDIAQGVFASSGETNYELNVYVPGPYQIEQAINFLFSSPTQGQNTEGQGEPYQSYSIDGLSLELGVFPGGKRFSPARTTG